MMHEETIPNWASEYLSSLDSFQRKNIFWQGKNIAISLKLDFWQDLRAVGSPEAQWTDEELKKGVESENGFIGIKNTRIYCYIDKTP